VAAATMSSVLAADLRLSGSSPNVYFGSAMGSARLSATCDGDTIEIMRMHVSGNESFTALLKGVPMCLNVGMSKPCVSTEAYPVDPAFYFEFTSPGGSLVLGPYAAKLEVEYLPDAKESTAVLAMAASVTCEALTPSMLTTITGHVSATVSVTVKHYVPTSSGSAFESDATMLMYRGRYGLDTFHVHETMLASPAPPPTAPPPPPPDAPVECNSYSTLQRGRGDCDSGLAAGWYRLEGDANVPSSSPGYNSCQTAATGWNNFALPTALHETTQGQGCFHYSSSTCQWSTGSAKNRVTNCGSYNVFFLNPSPTCTLRYCP